MPKGHEHDLLYSLSIRNMVFQTFTVHSRGKKAINITSKNGTTISFPLQSYSNKIFRKMLQKALEILNRMCSCPLGIP